MPDDRDRNNRIIRAVHPSVAFVFDFDRTLAERTTDALLRHPGIDRHWFNDHFVEPKVTAGWTERLAEAHALVAVSRTW